MNEMASRILGNVTKAQEAMGPPPELIGMDIPAAEPDATRVADLDESEFESLGRVPTPMPAASSPWRKDFRPGVTSPDSWPSNLHFDSDDFLDMMWRHKIARPVNALPSMMNFGLSLMDLAKMLDSPSGREQAVEMVYTMAKGAKNFAVEHNVFDGPLTQEGQVFAMGMEEIVATALDKDRSVNDPFGAMLDLMDGAGFLIGGLGDTAALAGRSEKFVKLMRKVRETSRKGDIKEATMLYSRGMRKMREQAVTPERMDLLERRLMERLQALYGRKIADDTPGGEIESLDTRLARGDLVYSYDTPDLKPKYREFWHMPLEGDIPMPHASIEDGIALSIEVYGPDPTPDQIIKSIEVIRTSDPRWRGKKNPVPVGAENVIRNMPLDELRGIYNAARAHALELERVSPGALDRILNWYPEFGKNIRREVGEENFAEAAVVFGITSQQSPVEQNLMDTYWVMNEVRKYLETPGVGMEKMTKAGLRQHLLDAREEVTATHQVRQTLDKLTSDQRKKYAQGVINPTSLERNPQVTYTGGPVSIIQKEYKAFIDGDSIDRIVDFYTSGMFSGDTKTQTYVTTLLHLTQGSGEGFFPWTTMDQHMARIFKIFKEGKEGTTDIGVFDKAGYRAAQYMTAKLAREVGMSHEQMQALLWFYSKNVLAE